MVEEKINYLLSKGWSNTSGNPGFIWQKRGISANPFPFLKIDGNYMVFDLNEALKIQKLLDYKSNFEELLK